MRLLLPVCVLFILTFASAGRVQAQAIIGPPAPPSLYCRGSSQFYLAQTPGAPDRVSQLFQQVSQPIAMRTCNDEQGNTHYFLRTTRPLRNGVCRLIEDEIFPGSSQDMAFIESDYHELSGMPRSVTHGLRGWSPFTPTAWQSRHYHPEHAIFAMLGDGECPLGESPRYINTSLPDGMVKAVVALFSKAMESEADFRAAFAFMLPPGGWDALPRMHILTFLHRFLAAQWATGTPAMTISAIVCDADTTGLCVIHTREPSQYYFSFDETGSGLKITGVSLPPVT